MSPESITEKFPKINETIIQSSIIFISIFATVGLLFGGTSQQFKTAYVYFGYMLYYSVPFIVAAFLSTISMLSYSERKSEAGMISFLAVCFFLTGLVMLIMLASLATQTVLLPSYFTFFASYQSLSVLVVVATAAFTIGPIMAEWILSRKRISIGNRKRILLICLAIFILSIFAMTTYGANQTSSVAAAGSVSLAGLPDYKLEAVNMSLLTADQLNVQINAEPGQSLSYVFLNEKNGPLYLNSTTKPSAQIIKSDFGSDLSFQTVVDSSGTYYLVMKSEYFLGTNATYSVKVFRTDTAVLVNAFFASVVSGALFLGTLVAEPESYSEGIQQQSEMIEAWVS